MRPAPRLQRARCAFLCIPSQKHRKMDVLGSVRALLTAGGGEKLRQKSSSGPNSALILRGPGRRLGFDVARLTDFDEGPEPPLSFDLLSPSAESKLFLKPSRTFRRFDSSGASTVRCTAERYAIHPDPGARPPGQPLPTQIPSTVAKPLST